MVTSFQLLQGYQVERELDPDATESIIRLANQSYYRRTSYIDCI